MAKTSSNPVIRPLIKFSIYAALCLVLLVVLAARVGNLHTLPFANKDHSYYAELPDASSLVPPDDVKIAGVTVGQVKGVSVRHGLAVVKFAVDKHVVLRQSTQVGMRFQNVIGAKYLYLYPGSSGDPVKAGGTFPVTQSVESADVGSFLTDIGAFLKALNPNDVNAFTEAIVGALQDNGTQVGQLLNNTASVAGTVGGLDTHVASIITNLEQVLQALASRNADLASVADHLASVSQELAARNDVLDNVVSNFGQVNNELNQLIGGNRSNLDQTISNLQVIANVLAQHHSDLNQGLATLSAGLAPYTLISAFGQWFQIRVVYTCLAQQTTCVYEDPANPPKTLANTPLNPGVAAAASAPSAAASAPSAAGSAPLVVPMGIPTTQPSIADIFGFALNGKAGG
ncbi:MAG TPA: MCE family protein [Acidimicrobiales bacterium]|nr:MCE family protein [Acidimicrobiales bacterium]